MTPIKTLVLSLKYPHRASYYDDWMDAFSSHPAFDCRIANILSLHRRSLAGMVDEHDLVVLLHSCTGDTTEYLARICPALADRKRSRLVAFVGNEYNSAVAPLEEKIATLRNCRTDVVATQLLREAGEHIYGGVAPTILSVPHALNPAIFRPGPPHEERRIDIGFRGFRYPLNLGDDDRNRLIDFFRENGPRLHLRVDIAQEKRFDRRAWSQFLGRCKGTVSTEAGSWFLEPDDVLARRVHAFLESKGKGLVISRSSWLRHVARRLPAQVKERLLRLLSAGPIRYEGTDPAGTSWQEVNEAFFDKSRKPAVYAKAISSRHFDAIGTKTCQILFPGRYNDILKPGVHYLELARDFSNVEDVLRRFSDRQTRQTIVDTSFDYVMGGHTLAHRLTGLAQAVTSG